jgi:hypothetical protein
MRRLTGLLAFGVLIAFACPAITLGTTQYSRDVQQVQMKLTELGYDPGPSDGIYGSRTETAVRAFQKDRGLPITGELNDSTRKELGLSRAQKRADLEIRQCDKDAFAIGMMLGATWWRVAWGAPYGYHAADKYMPASNKKTLHSSLTSLNYPDRGSFLSSLEDELRELENADLPFLVMLDSASLMRKELSTLRHFLEQHFGEKSCLAFDIGYALANINCIITIIGFKDDLDPNSLLLCDYDVWQEELSSLSNKLPDRFPSVVTGPIQRVAVAHIAEHIARTLTASDIAKLAILFGLVSKP